MKIKFDRFPHQVILFADLHAMLDNFKTTPKLRIKFMEYYERIFCTLLMRINVRLDKLKFIKGSDFQRFIKGSA